MILTTKTKIFLTIFSLSILPMVSALAAEEEEKGRKEARAAVLKLINQPAGFQRGVNGLEQGFVEVNGTPLILCSKKDWDKLNRDPSEGPLAVIEERHRTFLTWHSIISLEKYINLGK